MLSRKLLDALNKDRELNDEDLEIDPREFYPSLMEVYDHLLSLENSPTMVNYDRWGLERPPGLHSIVDNS